MESKEKTVITVETLVSQPMQKVWEKWNKPEHITKWYQASDDWHAPYAENDIKTGGRFKTTMAAKDGSFSFDFSGTHTHVKEHKEIESTLDDGRKMKTTFAEQGGKTKIVESFEAESVNSIDMQKGGWQAILDSFKKYAESKS